jgi:hypothetical protein
MHTGKKPECSLSTTFGRTTYVHAKAFILVLSCAKRIALDKHWMHLGENEKFKNSKIKKSEISHFNLYNTLNHVFTRTAKVLAVLHTL